MKKLLAILPGLLFYVPFGAGAALPVIAYVLIASGAAIAGFSIYRSAVPVSMSDGYAYFSSCWSCDIFSSILRNLSEFIPKIYSAIGTNVIPIAAGLTFVWFAWTILKDYIAAKPETDAWKITGQFGTHLIKLAFVAMLLAFPLPRFMTDTFVSPIMNIGLSYNNIVRTASMPEDTDFNTCMVATALNEKSTDGAEAYSPRLRQNITCQIAESHRITGLGMTLGWTFAQMAFSADYMLGPGIADTKLPLFPNVMLIFAGLTIMAMFLWGLFPVPIYFLEVFIKLTMDLVMLPLMLLGWLFNKWDIFPKGAPGIKSIIDDVVKNTCGIALVGLFTGFAVLFLGEVVGKMNGLDGLATALQSDDSVYLMNSLMLNNDSMANIIFAGIFIGMFMNAIPALVKKLFNNVSIPNSEKLQESISKTLKNVYDGLASKIKVPLETPKD